jgi:hypothetical protein
MEATAGELIRRITKLTDLATVGDRLLVVRGIPKYVERELTEERVRSYYELAYLRLCYTWEWFLEETFLQSLVRNPRISPGGRLRYPPFKSVAAARAALLSSTAYISWGNIGRAIQALDRFVDSGVHRQVIASYSSQLEAYLAVRHHVAHDSASSKAKFDAATRLLSSKTYSAGPGAFLRDRNRNQQEPTKWFSSIADDFVSLAQQIDP